MATGFYHIRALGTACAAFGWVAPAIAGGVPAGSLIENTATATYTANATVQSINSNTVTLTVDELLDTAVASQESGPVSASTSAVLRFKITNTGNGPEAFTLTANPAVGGNAFNATITGLAIDVNGNGVFDAGIDTALANGAVSPVLAADAPLDVLVLVTIPDAAAPGATSTVELTATASTGTGTPGTIFAGQGLSGGDAVVGATNASATAQAQLVANRTAVTLTKAAGVADPFGGARPVPSSIITYRIIADVTGTGTVTGLTIADVIPAGTTYVAGSLTLEGAALSDAADADAGEGSPTGVAVRTGDVAAGARRTVTFQVKIN